MPKGDSVRFHVEDGSRKKAAQQLASTSSDDCGEKYDHEEHGCVHCHAARRNGNKSAVCMPTTSVLGTALSAFTLATDVHELKANIGETNRRELWVLRSKRRTNWWKPGRLTSRKTAK